MLIIAPCNAGTIRQGAVCRDCAVGTFAREGDTTCRHCPEGTVGPRSLILRRFAEMPPHTSTSCSGNCNGDGFRLLDRGTSFFICFRCSREGNLTGDRNGLRSRSWCGSGRSIRLECHGSSPPSLAFPSPSKLTVLDGK